MRDLAHSPEFQTQSDMIAEMLDDIRTDFWQFGDVIIVPDELDTIESKPRDGFIPFTNGGFEIVACADFSAADGSGCVPNAISEMLESTKHDCVSSFRKDHGLPDDCDPWDEDQVSEETREAFYDYESTWLSEGCTYFYKVRAQFYSADNWRNDLGEPGVYFMAAINTDLEYGRDSVPWLRCYGSNPEQNVTGYSEEIPLREITPERLAIVAAKIREALANA